MDPFLSNYLLFCPFWLHKILNTLLSLIEAKVIKILNQVFKFPNSLIFHPKLILFLFFSPKKHYPNAPPNKYIMSIQTSHLDQLDQLDLQITKNLIPTSPQTAISFPIWGSSNGIIVQNIFKTKTMIFINPIVDMDILKFDLCLTSLEYTNKLVRRIPLVYSGLLLKTEHDKVGDIDRL